MAIHNTDRPIRRGFGQRVNRWLDEPDGETFKDGKWRFWFPMVIGFSVLNAVLTAMVFGSGGNLQTYMGAIMLSIGALLAWLCIGTLHYSDSKDAKMSRGVSALDSATLIFVIAHFCFLLWVQGHIWTLQAREADYKANATAYNDKAEKISGDNVKIAEATTKAEKLRNDTAYQQRRAAEAGLAVARASQKASGQSPALSVSPIELERPDKPKQSSTDFLTYWDFWVRLANFGELALAALTLIYIRNRSVKFNAQYSPQPIQMNYRGERTYRVLPDGRREITQSSYSDGEVGQIVDGDDFPNELDVNVVQDHRAGRRLDRTTKSDNRRQSPISAVSSDHKAALKVLREHLKAVSFYHPGFWFKADLMNGGVMIRMFRRRQGREESVASTLQSPKLLAAVNRPDFRARLIDELIRKDFPVEKR